MKGCPAQGYGSYTPYMQQAGSHQGYPAPLQAYQPNAAQPPRGPHAGYKRPFEGGLSPHDLNKRITTTYDPMAILQLVQDHGRSFDAVNVATCMHRIAKHKPSNMRAVFAHPGYTAILELISVNIRRFQAQQLANIMWAFATIEAQPPAHLLQARSHATCLHAEQGSLCWANSMLAGTAGHAGLGCGAGCAGLSKVVHHTFDIQALFSPLADRPCAAIDACTFNPREQVVTVPSLQAMSDAACVISRGFNPQNLANTLWGFAKLDHLPGEQLLQELSVCILRELPRFSAQNTSNMLWAFARLGHNPGPELLDAAAEFATRTVHAFAPQV